MCRASQPGVLVPTDLLAELEEVTTILGTLGGIVTVSPSFRSSKQYLALRTGSQQLKLTSLIGWQQEEHVLCGNMVILPRCPGPAAMARLSTK